LVKSAKAIIKYAILEQGHADLLTSIDMVEGVIGEENEV
jgi:hypothetical protein